MHLCHVSSLKDCMLYFGKRLCSNHEEGGHGIHSEAVSPDLSCEGMEEGDG
jgi:hypothetical protein